MKALSKARSAAGGAAARLGAGASRVRDGLSAAPRRTGRSAREGWRNLGGGFRWAATGVRDAVRDASFWVWRRSGIPRLIAAAQSNPRVAIAWAGGGLLACAWIAWAVYTTAEHGATAGLGVLITWPLAVGVLAIVAAPFVAAAMLIRRRRGGGPPRIAGGAEIPADSPEGEAMTGGTYPG